MGEANYYGGIQFFSTLAAKAARGKIGTFLKKGTAAYNDWQSHRDGKPGEKRSPAKERFLGIAARNQEVFEALDLMNQYEEYLAQFRQEGEVDAEDVGLNCLGGQISFPDDPTVSVEGNTVIFFGNTWCMANWGRLVEGMRKRFGGINAAWVSEEHVAGNEESIRAALLEKIREIPCKACDSILNLAAGTSTPHSLRM
jgi:hypothetical protein